MIKFDEWYKFDNETHRDIFIEECRNEMVTFTQKEYFKRELLTKPIQSAKCLKFNKITVTFNYRMDYNPMYMPNCNNYRPDFTTIFKMTEYNCDYIHKVNKTENNFKGETMNNEMVEELIRTYVEKEIKRINDKCDDEVAALIESSEIGQAAKAYLVIANKLIRSESNAPRLKINDLVYGDLIDTKTQECITALKTEAHVERNKLNEKKNELIALLSIAETYDQKIKLLKKYNIINK